MVGCLSVACPSGRNRIHPRHLSHFLSPNHNSKHHCSFYTHIYHFHFLGVFPSTALPPRVLPCFSPPPTPSQSSPGLFTFTVLIFLLCSHRDVVEYDVKLQRKVNVWQTWTSRGRGAKLWVRAHVLTILPEWDCSGVEEWMG